VLKSLFFSSADVGSQGNRSPLSKFQNAFVRFEAEASLPYVEKRSIVIEFSGPGYGHAVQGDATLFDVREQ